MLLLSFLLVPVVVAAAEEKIINGVSAFDDPTYFAEFGEEQLRTINNYVVKTVENILKSVQPTETSSRVLNLSGLDLQILDNNAFDNLATVKNLNLGNNSLSSIPNGLFSKLGNLEHLSLANNKITKFKKSFEGLDHLKTLNISNNPLTNFEGTDLSGLPKSSIVFTKGLSILTINAFVFEKEPGSENKPEINNEDVHDAEEDDKIVGNDEKSTNETQKNCVNSAKQESRRKRNIKYPDIKVCIDDDVLKMVETLKTNETLPSGCRKTKITEEFGYPVVHLENLGIARFEKGWYQLDDRFFKIKLSGNKIVQVTSELLNDLPSTVRGVDLSRNKIERLNRGIINNSHITVLVLDSNSIREIEAGAFENVPLLEELYLQDNLLTNTNFAATLPITIGSIYLQKNRITEITHGSFSRLRDVTFLSLDENLIREVKSDSLHGLSSLMEIRLTSNRITRIEPGSFQLRELSWIQLSNNSIAGFERGVFDNRKITTILDVSHNKLSNITENFPDGFNNLRMLKLDFNDIKKLERDTFANTSIEYLSLRGNKISSIECGSFRSRKLEKIFLDENLLNELDIESFHGLERLQRLSLIDNGITSIPKGFTKYMPNLDVLDFSENPIKRLQNGALYGFRRTKYNEIHLEKVPVEVIEAGLFDDM